MPVADAQYQVTETLHKQPIKVCLLACDSPKHGHWSMLDPITA
jgi:hypothetical protein